MDQAFALQRRRLMQAGGLGLALAPFGAYAAARVPELAPILGWSGQDRSADALQIEGRLPKDLRGTLYRNGPGLMARGDQRYQHWFDGDGLVQAWRIDGERQRASHAARFVQTDKFKAEQAAGRFLLPGLGTAIKAQIPVRGPDSFNTANTSVLRVGDELLALWEGGSAYRLDPHTLQTLGPKTWAPGLEAMPFSAHPKQDAEGRVWNFGSSPVGKLVLYEISAQGALLRHKVLDLPMPAMLHDFIVTERYLVFLLPPLTLDLQRLRDGASMAAAMDWRAAEATRVLVVRKSDLSVRRILELPAAMVFHFGNGWDEGEVIRLDYVQAPPMDKLNQEFGDLARGERPADDRPSTPRLLRIDLTSGRLDQQSRDESVEFPTVDPRVVMQRHRLVHYPCSSSLDRWGFDAVMRLDLDSGKRERFSLGPDCVVEEQLLVPKSGSRREGEAWLVGSGYDLRRKQSFLTVFDAEAITAGPLARVWLPYWVPYGFHGRFVAEV
ncbi:carotenoid oxygenase family protein [Pelomonas sp. SE-A7]|uniref:carotenoid oxygenase family protein n=1 Tax=Pelomonas sp. SE-A7 TaxID=3054953 RepID=UPI00259CE623|nr:carotenoid oxygenase family protein [Pelomonas sp. SE-A7]MDM4765487.1 carotenoid oxygenase family protein [Pelomonas sp. SE-A7]